MKLSLRTIAPAASVITIMVLVAFIVMPLRLALSGFADDSGSLVTAREVGGSIWDGEVADLQLTGIALGDVKADLSFWPLFVGRAEIQIASYDAAKASVAIGTVFSGYSGDGVKAMNGEFPATEQIGMLPVSRWQFDNFGFRFANGKCDTAGGNVRVFVDKGVWSALNLNSGLMGQARCDNKSLHLPLLSASAMERVDLHVFPTGEYKATITVTTADPDISATLSQAGFAPISGGYRAVSRGSF